MWPSALVVASEGLDQESIIGDMLAVFSQDCLLGGRRCRWSRPGLLESR